VTVAGKESKRSQEKSNQGNPLKFLDSAIFRLFFHNVSPYVSVIDHLFKPRNPLF
jgi:hypothetical protein